MAAPQEGGDANFEFVVGGMASQYSCDGDYIDLEDESDLENVESSEDEIDILLHGTPKQRKKLFSSRCRDSSSSEDDFEKEMEQELLKTVHNIEVGRKSLDNQNDLTGNSEPSAENSEPTNQEYYDDVYFDSDEDSGSSINQGDPKRKRHKVISNDELLYDPSMDDKDQKWMDAERRKYQVKDTSAMQQPPGLGGAVKNSKQLLRSDAVLSCPACMTMLCMDCQRHDIYTNQYRAMFVKNCIVDLNEILKYPAKKLKRKKQRISFADDYSSESPDDKYHPVKCQMCNTKVAVYDKDEVYHFFNVLTSYS